jgi:hypothetical protein
MTNIFYTLGTLGTWITSLMVWVMSLDFSWCQEHWFFIALTILGIVLITAIVNLFAWHFAINFFKDRAAMRQSALYKR